MKAKCSSSDRVPFSTCQPLLLAAKYFQACEPSSHPESLNVDTVLKHSAAGSTHNVNSHLDLIDQSMSLRSTTAVVQLSDCLSNTCSEYAAKACFCGSVLKAQLKGLAEPEKATSKVFMGTERSVSPLSSGPASSSSTRDSLFSERRLASTQPADPAPTDKDIEMEPI